MMRRSQPERRPFMVWCPKCERNISRWWEIDERGRKLWHCSDCNETIYEDEVHD